MQNFSKCTQRLSIIFYLTVISSSMFGQTTKRPFTVSSEFLITRDFSVQSPDLQPSFRVLSSGVEPALGIMFEFPVKKNLWFGTGYRWKHHWITWTSAIFKSNLWVEEAHSLPLKLTWKKKFDNIPILNRFILDCSGGFLLNKMVHPSVRGSNNVVIDTNDNIIYTIMDSYKHEDVNQVKASISLDGMAKIDYRLYKNLHLCLGYGYTQGFWSLAKGSYRVTGPAGFMDSGTIRNKGSYQYVVLGLRVAFRQNSTRY